MANTALGDIPGARFPLPRVTVGAVTSAAANALVDTNFGPFPHDIRVRNLYFIPTAADQGAAASYRRITALNRGTSGTGTTIIGSINLSASKASMQAASFVVDSTLTLAAGAMLAFSQLTVGGTDATGTVLQAGVIAGSYEVI